MHSFSFPATLTPEKDGLGYTVRFRNLPEAITSGRDRREALEQAAACLEEAIATRKRVIHHSHLGTSRAADEVSDLGDELLSRLEGGNP